MSLCFARNTLVLVMRVCDSNLKNAREMVFLFMLNCHTTITLVMTKKLTLSIRQSRYLIFQIFHYLFRFLVETKMNPFILSSLQKKSRLKKILLYGHFIGNGERFLKGFYLKLSRSKHISNKKFQLLPTSIEFAPDEVFDTCVEITEELHLDAQHFKLLIQKANS